MDIDGIQKRYQSLFGSEPTTPESLTALETLLNVKLPDDLRSISKFYSGGMIGGTPLNSIAPSGPASNIGEDTLRFRKAAELPHSMIVLGELDESFIVLDTNKKPHHPAVYWCDNNDVFNLADAGKLHSPHTWDSYEEFFESLLEDEEVSRRLKSK